MSGWESRVSIPLDRGCAELWKGATELALLLHLRQRRAVNNDLAAAATMHGRHRRACCRDMLRVLVTLQLQIFSWMRHGLSHRTALCVSQQCDSQQAACSRNSHVVKRFDSSSEDDRLYVAHLLCGKLAKTACASWGLQHE